jgi:hypothetical protein
MPWLVAVALAFTLASCSDVSRTDAVWVVNNTHVTLHFTIIKLDGKPFDLTDEVPPGELVGLLSGFQLDSDSLGLNRCTVGDLIAYDPNGREVARHPPGLCARTKDVWTIAPLGSPQPS